MDVLLIPSKDGFSDFPFSTCKIGSIVRTYNLWFSSSCHESSKSINERVGVHAVNHLNMYGTNSQAGKNNSIPLYQAASSFYHEGPKAVNANKREWGLVRCQSVSWKISHLLLMWGLASSFAIKAALQYVALILSLG